MDKFLRTISCTGVSKENLAVDPSKYHKIIGKRYLDCTYCRKIEDIGRRSDSTYCRKIEESAILRNRTKPWLHQLIWITNWQHQSLEWLLNPLVQWSWQLNECNTRRAELGPDGFFLKTLGFPMQWAFDQHFSDGSVSEALACHYTLYYKDGVWFPSDKNLRGAKDIMRKASKSVQASFSGRNSPNSPDILESTNLSS